MQEITVAKIGVELPFGVVSSGIPVDDLILILTKIKELNFSNKNLTTDSVNPLFLQMISSLSHSSTQAKIFSGANEVLKDLEITRLSNELNKISLIHKGLLLDKNQSSPGSSAEGGSDIEIVNSIASDSNQVENGTEDRGQIEIHYPIDFGQNIIEVLKTIISADYFYSQKTNEVFNIHKRGFHELNNRFATIGDIALASHDEISSIFGIGSVTISVIKRHFMSSHRPSLITMDNPTLDKFWGVHHLNKDCVLMDLSLVFNDAKLGVCITDQWPPYFRELGPGDLSTESISRKLEVMLAQIEKSEKKRARV